jgi:serine/threonine protein phosphatase 1
VGDLHGMYSLLETQLERLNFDPASDRVFSVGDLVDRGPESYRVLEFLDQPWFHAIKGNHEMMLIEAKHKKTHYRSWIKNWGGDWWEDIDPITQSIIREEFERLPVIFEIESNQGHIGIVHADVPVSMTWQEIVHGVHTDEEVRDYLMWSRNGYKHIESTGKAVDVEGIDLVVIGHNLVKKPLQVSNLFYIDTGAYMYGEKDYGSLTLLEIHPEIIVHQFPKY